jgi:hypothetical protein
VSDTQTGTLLVENVQVLKDKNGKDWWKADKGVRSFRVDLTQYDGKQIDANFQPQVYKFTDRDGNPREQQQYVVFSVNSEEPAPSNGAAPAPYEFKGKTRPEDQRAINRREAYRLAVSLVTPINVTTDLGDGKADIDPFLAKMRYVVATLAYQFEFGLNATTDEQHKIDESDGIPF